MKQLKFRNNKQTTQYDNMRHGKKADKYIDL